MPPKQDKSTAIRSLLDKEPDLTPAELKDKLAARGIKAEYSLCKVVRHRYVSKGEPKKKRPLRSDEQDIGTSKRRLKDEDHEIQFFVGQFVAAELHELFRKFPLAANYGTARNVEHVASRLYSLPRIRKWLNAVKTWRSKARRRALLQKFIEELKSPYPPLGRSTARGKVEFEPLDDDDEPDSGPVELTLEERKAKIAAAQEREARHKR